MNREFADSSQRKQHAVNTPAQTAGQLGIRYVVDASNGGSSPYTVGVYGDLFEAAFAAAIEERWMSTPQGTVVCHIAPREVEGSENSETQETILKERALLRKGLDEIDLVQAIIRHIKAVESTSVL